MVSIAKTLLTKAITLFTLAFLVLAPYQAVFAQEGEVTPAETTQEAAPVEEMIEKSEEVEIEASKTQAEEVAATNAESEGFAAIASAGADDTFDDRLDYNNGYFTGKVDERTGAFGYGYGFAFV